MRTEECMHDKPRYYFRPQQIIRQTQKQRRADHKEKMLYRILGQSIFLICFYFCNNIQLHRLIQVEM